MGEQVATLVVNIGRPGKDAPRGQPAGSGQRDRATVGDPAVEKLRRPDGCFEPATAVAAEKLVCRPERPVKGHVAEQQRPAERLAGPHHVRVGVAPHEHRRLALELAVTGGEAHHGLLETALGRGEWLRGIAADGLVPELVEAQPRPHLVGALRQQVWTQRALDHVPRRHEPGGHDTAAEPPGRIVPGRVGARPRLAR